MRPSSAQVSEILGSKAKPDVPGRLLGQQESKAALCFEDSTFGGPVVSCKR